MSEVLFYITILFVMIDARINLIKMRSSVPEMYSINLFKTIIAFVATIASWSVVVWGFMNFDWWIPIVTLLAMSFPASFLVRNSTYRFFISISLITDIIIIGTSAFIWLN